jgi:putative NADH-flavin reductase
MVGKKILVFGATGPLGIYICQKALKNGHQLTIYARNPSKLPAEFFPNSSVKVRDDPDQRLTTNIPNQQVIKGEIDDETLLTSTIKGQEVIISALGPVLSLSSWTVPPGTLTNAYRLIFAGMRQYNVNRIFLMGTPTIVDPQDKGTFISSAAVFALRVMANSAYSEIVSLGKLLDEEAGDLDWTMYRVGNLSNANGNVMASFVGDEGWSLTCFRQDVAGWILGQVGKEVSEFVRARPALSSRKRVV